MPGHSLPQGQVTTNHPPHPSRAMSSPVSVQGTDKAQIGVHDAKKLRVDSAGRSVPGQGGVGVVPVPPGNVGPHAGVQGGQPTGAVAVNDDGMLVDEAGRLVGRRKAVSGSLPNTSRATARPEVHDDNKPIIVKPGGGSVKISGAVQYRGVRQRPWGKCVPPSLSR